MDSWPRIDSPRVRGRDRDVGRRASFKYRRPAERQRARAKKTWSVRAGCLWYGCFQGATGIQKGLK